MVKQLGWSCSMRIVALQRTNGVITSYHELMNYIHYIE